ncbi:hypothetical protein [Sinosporangium album]|uniref:hypothetical protein n=1 Tax=Sinosporangium album TaxID=504805 RepID=UPI000B865BEF|nr:hypothetical protein [Sinosporangium album]
MGRLVALVGVMSVPAVLAGCVFVGELVGAERGRRALGAGQVPGGVGGDVGDGGDRGRGGVERPVADVSWGPLLVTGSGGMGAWRDEEAVRVQRVRADAGSGGRGVGRSERRWGPRVRTGVEDRAERGVRTGAGRSEGQVADRGCEIEWEARRAYESCAGHVVSGEAVAGAVKAEERGLPSVEVGVGVGAEGPRGPEGADAQASGRTDGSGSERARAAQGERGEQGAGRSSDRPRGGSCGGAVVRVGGGDMSEGLVGFRCRGRLGE